MTRRSSLVRNGAGRMLNYPQFETANLSVLAETQSLTAFDASASNTSHHE